MSDADRSRALVAGAQALGVPLAPAQVTALLAYLDLLARWNQAFNLTAIRDPDAMVVKHLLDSLAIAPFVPDHGRLVDVGTGAGLPGIPLAVVRPGLQVTLLDSNSKKTRFCTQAGVALGLGNLTVVHARVEQHRPAQPYDLVVSRAFAELADFLAWTAHLGGPATRWLAMKGAPGPAELANIPPGFTMRARHPLAVPGLGAERELIELARI